MTRVECLGCGHVLALPPSIAEGAEFACAHCGLVMMNVQAARTFRWRDVDPYVRRHGASRVNLWGGLGGAFVWVPVLAIVLAARGELDALFIAALALPYLALLAVLGTKRARTPASVWMHWLWVGLGAYCLYVGVLLVLVPRWEPLFAGTSGAPTGPLPMLGFGAVAVVVGAVGVLLYRRRQRSVPRISGTPPEVA